MTKLFNKKQQTPLRKSLRHTMSKAEALLWIQLSRKQLMGYKFRRQYGIGNYVVDFYCPKLKLAIEVDGSTHVTDKKLEYDKQRQTEIEGLGICFVRFMNPEIYSHMDGVLEKIRERVKELST